MENERQLFPQPVCNLSDLYGCSLHFLITLFIHCLWRWIISRIFIFCDMDIGQWSIQAVGERLIKYTILKVHLSTWSKCQRDYRGIFCHQKSSNDSTDLKKLVFPGICIVTLEGAQNGRPHSSRKMLHAQE